MTQGSDGDPTREALADELLAIRCQLGEPGAFDGLVERWHEPLWRYARRLTDGDEAAADAVQDIARGAGALLPP